jgi:protein-S-isoprenylcysteine O-methyltransferase Ste14
MKPIIYDLLMRLPLSAWMSFCAVVHSAALIRLVNIAAPIDPVYVIHIAMRLSAIAFLLTLAAATMLRTRPSGKASGFEPRISALVGTFMMYSIVLFPRHELSLPLEMISTILTLIGAVGAIASLSQLGRSFSLMAETRQLVTSGPYRFVRHPLYLAEEIAMVGLFMQFASVWTALLFAVQIAFQLRRMHNEESVLTASFPQYVVYQQTTARLIPGIY